MYSGAFWKATFERALFTFVEAYFGLWLAGDLVFNIFEFDFVTGLGPALGAAVLMVVKALIAAHAGGNNSPSFANEVLVEDAPSPRPRSAGGHE